MTNLNFLSKSSSRSCGHRVTTLALTVGSPSAHRRGTMLRLLSVLVLILTFGVGNVWGTNADVDDALWSEDFSSFSNGDKPSTHSGTGWGSASITYSQGNNDTKAYTGEMSAGGTSPELLIKPSDSWTISGIPTGGATEMALSFKSNKTTFAVTTSTADLTITGSGKSWTITVKEGKATPSTFNLAVKNSGNKNARVDNVELVVVTAAAATGCTGQKLGTPVVTAEASSGQVRLTWPAVSNASGYQLKWNGGDWAAATSPVTKTGLTNGTAYTYQVKAIGNGSTYCDGDASAEASATPNVYHTVTWTHDGSSVTTQVIDGQKPTFPEKPTSCDVSENGSKTFVGWTQTPWSGKKTKTQVDALTTTATKVYTTASDMPNVTDDIEYHAVFCKGGSLALATSIAANDVIYLATAANGSGVTGYDGTKDATISTTVSEWMPFTVSTVSGGYNLTNGTNKVIAASASFKVTSGTASTLTFEQQGSTGQYRMIYNDGSYDYALGINSSNTSCRRFYKTSNSYTWFYVFKNSAGTNYMTTCCTSLGSINGSVSLSQTTATLTWDDLANVAESNPYAVTYRKGSEAYGSANVGEITTNAQGKKTCTITGLECGTEYDFKIAVTGDGSHCDAEQVLEDKSTTKWNITYNLTNTVDLSEGPEQGANACGEIEATFTKNSSYTFPGAITVTVGGAALATNQYTWNSSTGALSIAEDKVTGDVAITIAGVAPLSPIISATPNELDFGEPKKNEVVTAKTFALTGSNLTDANTVTVTAPTGFLVSIGEGEPAASLEITPSSGSVSATIIVTPVTTAAGDKSGNITISSADLASNVTVALTMTVQETYTVNFYINDIETPAVDSQTDVQGTALTVPSGDALNISDCAGADYVFMGWTNTSSYTHGTSTLITNTTGLAIGNADANYYAVFALKEGEDALTWNRVTSVATLTAGGTFIMGYEADHDNAGVIIPMQNTGTATTSAAGYIYSGTGNGTTNKTATIDMSSIAETSKYEFTIESGDANGKIAIKFGSNYVGRPNTGQDNKVKLYTAKSAHTDLTPTIGDNDVVTLAFNDSVFRYNTGSGNERFSRYSAGANSVIYKKNVSTATYSNYRLVCPHYYTISLTNEGVVDGKGSFVADKASALAGESVTLTATDTENAGQFNSWSITGLDSYSATTNPLTFDMPDNDITVSATFDALYAINKELVHGTFTLDKTHAIAGETVTISNVAADAQYKNPVITVFKTGDESATISVTAGVFTMPAYPVTVRVVCEPAIEPLAAPVLGEATDATYQGVTLNWTGVAGNEGYVLTVQQGGVDVEGLVNVAIAQNATSYTIASGLAANTAYTYSIYTKGNGTTTMEVNTPANGNFSTEDYPTVKLFYSENGELSAGEDKQILTDFELAAPASDPCTKKFVGWSTVTVAETNVAPAMMQPGDTYQIPSNASETWTIYAVYATATPGAATDVFSENFSSITEGNSTANTGSGDAWTPNANFNSSVTAVYKAGGAIRLGKSGSITTKSLDLSSGAVTVSFKLKGWSSNENTVTVQVDDQTTQNATCTGYMSTGNFESKELTFATGTSTSVVKFTTNGSTRVFVDDIVISVPGASTYSAYATTCAATPAATPSVDNLNNVVVAGASGTITMEYENVNTANVAVSLWNNEACTEAFDGGWLTALLNGDKNITYTIVENTSYEVRTAYIKLTAPQTTGATEPAVVVIPVSQAMKPAIFSSLEDLVAANVNSGVEVTVSFSNILISDDIQIASGERKGVMLNVKASNDKDIEIYYAGEPYVPTSPTEWVKNGYVSATNLVATWTHYTQYSNDQWELIPSDGFNWSEDLVYQEPKAVSSVVVTGAPTKTAYVDGEQFNPAGLTVTVNYTVGDPDVVAASCADWTYEPDQTMSLGENSISVQATYNSVTSVAYPVTGLTVSEMQDKTIAQFVGAEGGRCYLEGIVSNLTNATKGYFDITDATGTLHIYGCDGSNAAGVANGDKVKLIAEVYELYGEPAKPEAKSTQYVSHISPVAITITDAESLSVEKDLTLTISATTEPAAAAANITYSVKAGSEDYASVEGNVVTGLAKGTATIIASIPAGEGYLANSVEFEVEVVEYYSITYDENGGSVVADVAKALELPDPLPETTRENYTFNGWFTTSTFNDGTEAVAGAALANDAILYAKWTEIPVWARTYTSNVTLVGGGTKEVAVVKVYGDPLATEYPAVKAGSGNNYGTVSVTLPAGTTELHFHSATWNGSGTCTIQIEDLLNTNPTFVLTNDAGMKNSGTYTLEGDMSGDQYYSVTFDALEEAKTITFSHESGTDKRFIIYGVNAIFPEITLSPATYDFESVRANQTKSQVFTIIPNENVSGALNASITNPSDNNDKFSVSAIEDNKVTVTFDPDGAESGTFTAKLHVWASNAEVKADLTGTAIAAAAPEIVVNKNAVAFGRVDPNAEVSEAIAVQLLHIDGAVSAAITGDDAAKFGLSADELTANGDLVITPNTSAIGVFSATLRLTATDADVVEVPLSITVSNKWAVTYTSNVTVTAQENKNVKVGSDDTNYNAYKKGDGSGQVATIHLPMGTQKLHLHMVAWKGAAGNVTVSGDCFSSSKSIGVTANDDVSGTGNTYTFTEKLALSYYHEIAIDNEIGAGGVDVTVSYASKRIVLFGVNEEGGIHELPAGETSTSTLPAEINLLVGEGKTLNVNSDVTLNNLTVEAGGTVSGSGELNVQDLTINTQSGKSGQVTGSNVSVNGDIYLEIKLDASGTMDPTKYYCISAPFDVNMNGGFFWGNGDQMGLNQDFQLFEYQGSKRASTGNGWQRVSGTMKKNTAYFIGFDDENTNNQNVIRLKAANKNLLTDATLELQEHEATYGQTEAELAKNADWNGLGNPRLHYVDLNKTVSIYEPSTVSFQPYDAESANGFVVGTAFFVHGTGDLSFANPHHGTYRAPKRESANYSYCVEITKENASSYDNRLYVKASETASTSFEEGVDLPTLNNETSKYGALIWTENYGMRLAIEEAPLVNSSASYELGIYAPANGSYVISVAEAQDNADLYLTYEGSIIWNLSMGEYELDLEKGTTNGYGLLLQAKAPQVVTGVDEVDAETGIQKIIIDEHVFILRGGQMYDVTGKMVK